MELQPSFPQMMARYNRWQNDSLFRAAATLTDAERRADRGGFWTSIHATLSHLYWGDRMWLSRFGRAEPPGVPLAESGGFVGDWNDLCGQRATLDDVIVTWADAFGTGPIRGNLDWYSGAAKRDVSAPLAVVIPHIFNHQTHHRGQVHAMLTSAGAKPDDTDLFLMPSAYWAELELP